MASAISHGVAALCIGAAFYRREIPKRTWVVGALCSMLPDVDIIGFHFGVRYGDFWGHRGFTHSLLFAGLIAVLATLVLSQSRNAVIGRSRLLLYLFLATASHGVLDAMTNGGLGVAFFSPFDTHRYFLPWRPIRVSPIGVARFFSPRGLGILENEILWIWLPGLAFAAMALVWRRTISRRLDSPTYTARRG